MRTLIPLVTILGSLYAVPGSADEQPSTPDENSCADHSDDRKCLQVLPDVRVSGRALPTGMQLLDSELIEQLPTGEGNLADLLRTNPAVSFSRDGRGSANSAVMRPEEFSFHGQPYYQNLFMIDGIDTTSDINPGSGGDLFSSPSLTGVVGGSSPQGYYLDVDLLEQVEVYDSNIPARFGGFTGGVVSSRIKRYDGNDFIDVRYGIQRDEWESFHLDPGDEEEFEQADSYNAEFTPTYRKDNYTLSAQQGLGENTGLTLGASRRSSTFLQTYTGETGLQHRTYYDDSIDNLHAKIDHQFSERLHASLSLRHADRTHDGLTSTRYDDMFTKSHNSWGIGGNLEYQLLSGARFTLDMALDRMSDQLDSDSNLFTRHESLEGSLPTQSGGYGDITQRQTTINLSPELVLPAMQLGASRHQISFGGDFKYSDSYYKRPETTTFLEYSCIQDNGSNGCIDQDGSGSSDYGDEYLSRAFYYGAGEVALDYTSVALYLEDQIEHGNWRFRLGLRAGYNNWLKNIDLAPRFSAEWDAFSDGSTRLLAGANRYYGRSFLRYAINDVVRSWSTLNFYDEDGNLTKETQYDDRSGNLDLNSPYSDELMLGWIQQAGPFNSTLKLVQRTSRDSIRRIEDDEGSYYYDNEGSSDTRSITWELDHARHPLRIGASETFARLSVGWRDIESDLQSDDAYDQEVEYDPIYYKGRLIDSSELPAWDYNTPLSVSLSTVTRIPAWNLTWSNFINLRSGGTIARDSGDDYTDSLGSRYDIYEDYTLDDLVTLDTKLLWKPRLWSASQGYLMVEVSNLFDDVISTNTSRYSSISDTYTPGRKLWLEVGMRF